MTAAAAERQVTAWTLDSSHSHVEFAVRHMMVATAKGRFADVKGTVTWDGADLSSAHVDVEIPIDTIDTRNADRDAHLKSPDFFDAATHPTMTFKSTKITTKGGNEFTIEGALTIRGTTRPITLTAKSNGQVRDPWGMDRAGFSATGQVDRLAYGLHWNAALEAGGLVVAQDVKIALEIELTKN
ncbi:MAG: YceI family protein [Gemmatimonadetes bacterium]|jgi:polyisoprenoid-binding protein YceI|nr:YceI family protein [Gemmatimonadota bacterium]